MCGEMSHAEWQCDPVCGFLLQEATIHGRHMVVMRSALGTRQWLWGEFGHLGDHDAVETAEEARRRAADWAQFMITAYATVGSTSLLQTP
jgi:hypothetical protein